jgi:putative chitinase
MNRAKFFDTIRHTLFNGKLSPDQVSGTESLLGEIEAAKWPLAHAAYGLATAFHETARTMQPIAEYGRGKGKEYGRRDPQTGHAYFGRGFVQLTWRFNYEKAEKELGYELVKNPDLAMRADIAAAILVKGMAAGWFTTKANKHYLNKEPPDYVGARRIINGTDKAELIAGYARKFAIALEAAGYGAVTKQPSVTASIPASSGEPVTKPLRHDGKHESPPGFWSRLAAAFKKRLSA